MPPNLTHAQAPRRDFNASQVPCGHTGCNRFFKTTAGRTKHILSAHPIVSSPEAQDDTDNHTDADLGNGFQDSLSWTDLDSDLELDDQPEELRSSPAPDVHAEFFGPRNSLYRNYHTKLNGNSFICTSSTFMFSLLFQGRPCDAHGRFLPDGAPPTPSESKSPNDWTPFRNRIEFETAELLYVRNQMSAGQADRLFDLWASTLLKHGDLPPFADHRDLYTTIDSIPLGGVKWEAFSCVYTGEKPDGNYPSWMDGSYDVWYRNPHEVVRNMLANPAYSDEMDYRPYREYSTNGDERQWRDFMSADWAWDQAVRVSFLW